ncbi:MAG: type II toxin-antitoxin system Phd/YefM family antitoxin [Oscillospiraceae bacterium]|nr:type II toxin-antitoxin system Phd/YefM family antitoxin [Oscillospiraceae bacterium]
METTVKQGQPVYLTKNGYGSMVVLSLEQYAALTDEVEIKLDEADRAAALNDVRYTEDQVFDHVRGRIHERQAL